MQIQEKLPDAPQERGFLLKIRQGVSTIRKGLKWLFTEDPRIREILTPQFLNEFYKEYLRMCRERREGVRDADSEASFLDAMKVDGYKTLNNMFDILMTQYPQINALPDPLQQKVRQRLLDRCGLIMWGLA